MEDDHVRSVLNPGAVSVRKSTKAMTERLDLAAADEPAVYSEVFFDMIVFEESGAY